MIAAFCVFLKHTIIWMKATESMIIQVHVLYYTRADVMCKYHCYGSCSGTDLYFGTMLIFLVFILACLTWCQTGGILCVATGFYLRVGPLVLLFSAL